jgi:hypothetical protein
MAIWVATDDPATVADIRATPRKHPIRVCIRSNSSALFDVSSRLFDTSADTGRRAGGA